MIVNSAISQADGNTRLLHQPVGQGYWLLLSAKDGVSVDVVVPPLDSIRLGSNSTMAASLAEGGVSAAWLTTLQPSTAGGGSSTVAKCFAKPSDELLGRPGSGSGSGNGNGDGAAARACFYDATQFLVRDLCSASVLFFGFRETTLKP